MLNLVVDEVDFVGVTRVGDLRSQNTARGRMKLRWRAYEQCLSRSRVFGALSAGLGQLFAPSQLSPFSNGRLILDAVENAEHATVELRSGTDRFETRVVVEVKWLCGGECVVLEGEIPF